MTRIARDDFEPMLKRGGGNDEVSAVMPKSRREPSPTPCCRSIHVNDSVRIEGQYGVQPRSQWNGERRIPRLLLRDTMLNLANGNNAQVKIWDALPRNPFHDMLP
jgi:hypothetical protein